MLKKGALPFAGHQDFSNLDQPYYPNAGLSKADILRYYHEVADMMIPHLANRPLTLERFPEGVEQKGFFQKSALGAYPEWVTRVQVPRRDGGTMDMVICNDEASLLFLVNQAAITFHIWLSQIDRLEIPDRLVIDLDPPNSDFTPVKQGAFFIFDQLVTLGMPLYLMTTGSRGLHLLIPLIPEADFDAVRDVAKQLVEHFSDLQPGRFTTEHLKSKRGQRIYLDIARNAYGQTTVCPYSLRPKAGAPVATPIAWKELAEPGFHSQRFNFHNVTERLKSRGDPWVNLAEDAISFKCLRNMAAQLK